MVYRLDIHDQAFHGIPPLEENDDDPILAPGHHPDMGSGWTLYYLNLSGQVETFHVPTKLAPDVITADRWARQHLARISGDQAWLHGSSEGEGCSGT